MVRQAALRIDDLNIGDVVLDIKKNVNGTITGINGTTVHILFPGSAIAQSWMRLGGLALSSPPPPPIADNQLLPSALSTTKKRALSDHVKKSNGKKKKVDNVVNNDVNNDVINNVINNVEKRGRKKKADITNANNNNVGGTTTALDVTNANDNNVGGTTTALVVPKEFEPSIEEEVIHVIDDDHDGVGLNDNNVDLNDNNVKCCLGDICQDTNGALQLENCSECKCKIHHICSDDGKCPEGFGCRHATKEGASTTGATTVAAATGYTIRDIATVVTDSDLKSYFGEKQSGATDFYVKVSVVYDLIMNAIFHKKLHKKEIDENNVMMITNDDLTGINKTDDDICQGFYSPAPAAPGLSEEENPSSIIIRYKNSGRGWLMDLTKSSFKHLLNESLISKANPKKTVLARAATTTAVVPTDISEVIKGLDVLYEILGPDYGENDEDCKRAVYVVPAKSMLLKHIYDNVGIEIEFLDKPLLVKAILKTEEDSVTVISFDSLPDTVISCLITMKFCSLEALMKTKNFECIKGFGNNVTTFPSLLVEGDCLASTALLNSISSQKSSSIVKLSYPVDEPTTDVYIQQLKHCQKHDLSCRESVKGKYIIVDADGNLDAKIEVKGRSYYHDLVYAYVCAHCVTTKEAVVMLDTNGCFTKKEVTKLLLCSLYCQIASRKEKDFILLKIMTTMCNSRFIRYLVYNSEKGIIELLKLRASQVDCDFSKVVPRDILATAKHKMIEFLHENLLLYDLALGISIANPKFADDNLDTAPAAVQLKEFEMYVPVNYSDMHEYAYAQLANFDIEDEGSSDDEAIKLRSSSRIMEEKKKKNDAMKNKSNDTPGGLTTTPRSRISSRGSAGGKVTKKAAAAKSAAKSTKRKYNDGLCSGLSEEFCDNMYYDFNDENYDFDGQDFKHQRAEGPTQNRQAEQAELDLKKLADQVALDRKKLEDQKELDLKQLADQQALELKKLDDQRELDLKQLADQKELNLKQLQHQQELQLKQLDVQIALSQKELDHQKELDLKQLELQHQTLANSHKRDELYIDALKTVATGAVSSVKTTEDNIRLREALTTASTESRKREQELMEFITNYTKVVNSK